jgi:hypothetical protein
LLEWRSQGIGDKNPYSAHLNKAIKKGFPQIVVELGLNTPKRGGLPTEKWDFP